MSLYQEDIVKVEKLGLTIIEALNSDLFDITQKARLKKISELYDNGENAKLIQDNSSTKLLLKKDED